jgi:hypothetical protein
LNYGYRDYIREKGNEPISIWLIYWLKIVGLISYIINKYIEWGF